QIVAVRFADAPADTDLASLTDQDRLLPGEGGGIDCAAILRHLAEHDFAGPLTLYPHASRLRGMTRDAIVQRARDALDTLFRSAGVNRTGQTLGAHFVRPQPPKRAGAGTRLSGLA
ncbi:MAG: hypothetical protein MUF48_19210, partial [Pirellulaceae bacterium]|nr:hypothetical protein [Pirellulaceae bacterium]